MEKERLLVLAFPHLLPVMQVQYICPGASRMSFHLNSFQLQLISLPASLETAARDSAWLGSPFCSDQGQSLTEN